jgi:endonuclease/exonuclease/phosphatase family metal-dependent hydrolase
VSGCEERGISVFECVEADCKEQYDELSNGCKLCLAANTTSPTSCATVGANEFGNDGRNGLILLSKTPIEDPKYTAFDTALIKRGVINATIDGVQIQCTHMTSDLSSVPYPTEDMPYGSWSDEHRAQIDIIANSADKECSILLGDLNAAVRDASGGPELPYNFQAILDAGYWEPWEQPECTFCQENPLAGSSKDIRLDHVLFKGCPQDRDFWFRRVFDRSVNVESDGKRHTTRISDHYGVEATIGGDR